MEKGKCLENAKDFGDRHRNVTQKPLLKNRAVRAARNKIFLPKGCYFLGENLRGKSSHPEALGTKALSL